MPGLQEVTRFLQQKFEKQIKAHHVLDASDGDCSPFPSSLDPRLMRVLAEDGISTLYSHQAEAFDAIGSNKNTLLVSHTASGKTLSFLLPILNEYITATLVPNLSAAGTIKRKDNKKIRSITL